MYKIIAGVFLIVAILGGIYFIYTDYNKEDVSESKPMTALIETTKGNFKIEFYPEDAPKTVENFVTLAKKGFYDGLTFHRVIPGFMVQGGDPECSKEGGRCGTGGPGYRFPDELNPATPSYQEGYKKGVMAMANSGPDTNGSQFFVMVADVPLPHAYTIFGKVIEGQEVVDAISLVKRNAQDRPLEPVVITKVAIF